MVSMPDVDDACIACLMCSIMVDKNLLYSLAVCGKRVLKTSTLALCATTNLQKAII